MRQEVVVVDEGSDLSGLSDTSDVVEPLATGSTYYDVVIRYRRGDTSHHDFISHLRAALSRTGISVQEDFDEVDSVPECRVMIICLTTTYFSSALLNILEQDRRECLVVYPVFYGISSSALNSNSKVFDGFFFFTETRQIDGRLL